MFNTPTYKIFTAKLLLVHILHNKLKKKIYAILPSANWLPFSVESCSYVTNKVNDKYKVFFFLI